MSRTWQDVIRRLWSNRIEKGITDMIIKDCESGDRMRRDQQAAGEYHLPEFAFAGKSNVGKSSLINALMNRKAYARTSSQPGKTQTINFYNINDALYYVDLPGYGYAKVAVGGQGKVGEDD